MILSNVSLRKRLARRDSKQLVVHPISDRAIQPASIDLRLGMSMKVWTGPLMDSRNRNPAYYEYLAADPALSEKYEDLVWLLQPGLLYLGVAYEKISVPLDLVGHLTGVSTRAREGIVVHQQAGLLDPGWEGYATFEITVTGGPTAVYNGQRIAQVYFQALDEPASPGYSGRYQDDVVPQPPKGSE